jgi:hypothetical protein
MVITARSIGGAPKGHCNIYKDLKAWKRVIDDETSRHDKIIGKVSSFFHIDFCNLVAMDVAKRWVWLNQLWNLEIQTDICLKQSAPIGYFQCYLIWQ